ncbi:MAG: hypothetical protein LBH62_01695 [Nitrososphaerota archaeon]|jgi:hypothetical protein|nr:hypothetical protein [Nitrososphaerota archaeon]
MSKIRLVFFAFSLILTACLLGVVIVNLFVDGEKLGANNPFDAAGSVSIESFTCNADSEYEFSFSVNVDLSDGMNANEAEIVARCLYETTMSQTDYEVKDVASNREGIWTVFLLWGSVSPDGEMENHSHYYNVHVNAIDRTVEYDRCF